MNTLMVWYFLTQSVVAIGPFATKEQCEAMAKWAFQYKYVSECWQAPIAQLHSYSIESNPKTGSYVR